MGHLDEVRALLKLNASLTARDGLGYTPLLCAAFSTHSDIVKELLQAGADITQLSSDNETALHLVLKSTSDNDEKVQQQFSYSVKISQ